MIYKYIDDFLFSVSFVYNKNYSISLNEIEKINGVEIIDGWYYFENDDLAKEFFQIKE